MREVAILDDYRNASLRLADWSAVRALADITVFDRKLSVAEAARELRGFEVICLLRERMAIPRALIEELPALRFIAATGNKHHGSLDIVAASAAGILCSYTPGHGAGINAAAELAWGLIFCLARKLPLETAAMSVGGWQNSVGIAVAGRTLGLLGLGRLGQAMVPVARALGMHVIAWSHNLTTQAAEGFGARGVSKDELFGEADFLCVQVTLSERTRRLVGRRELSLMKPTSYLINTARGPIVDQAALIDALQRNCIAGAALDVFDEEPLPDVHPLRGLENCLLTPHIGYNVEELLATFYADTVENVAAYLSRAPIRLLNPEVLDPTRA